MLTLFSLLALISCSVKEVRGECPCYLDIKVMRQAEQLFPDNKTWCSVWNGPAKTFDDVLTPVVGADAATYCAFPRNGLAAVVVSSAEQNVTRISVRAGEQMTKLYLARKDVSCTGDNAEVVFDSFCKQHINVTFTLNEEAYPYKDNLKLTLDGPYDGVELPSLAPHTGTFNYTTTFDGAGRASLRIPPQGGPGLKASIQLGSNPPAVVDLYHTMIDAGFNFRSGSMDDFETTLGLNTVASIIEIVDWNVVNMEDVTY